MRTSSAGYTALIASIFATTLAAGVAAQGAATDPGRPGAARADQAPGRDARPAVGSAERKFMTGAAMGGMAEVEGGQLAAKKATTKEVKEFGQRMVDDHGKANEELKRIAATKGVQLPTQLDRKHRGDLERLAKLSGADFDREYMEYMVKDHKKDVAEFKKAAQGLTDADVKQFASSKLPTLEEHLRMAEQAAADTKDRSAKR
jgi:putative membrane protein